MEIAVDRCTGMWRHSFTKSKPILHRLLQLKHRSIVYTYLLSVYIYTHANIIPTVSTHRSYTHTRTFRPRRLNRRSVTLKTYRSAIDSFFDGGVSSLIMQARSSVPKSRTLSATPFAYCRLGLLTPSFSACMGLANGGPIVG